MKYRPLYPGKYYAYTDAGISSKLLEPISPAGVMPLSMIKLVDGQGRNIISGESKGLIEAVELHDHPWFVAVQFHPEFTSRLQNPNRIILAFIQQALKNKQQS